MRRQLQALEDRELHREVVVREDLQSLLSAKEEEIDGLSGQLSAALEMQQALQDENAELRVQVGTLEDTVNMLGAEMEQIMAKVWEQRAVAQPSATLSDPEDDQDEPAAHATVSAEPALAKTPKSLPAAQLSRTSRFKGQTVYSEQRHSSSQEEVAPALPLFEPTSQEKRPVAGSAEAPQEPKRKLIRGRPTAGQKKLQASSQGTSAPSQTAAAEGGPSEAKAEKPQSFRGTTDEESKTKRPTSLRRVTDEEIKSSQQPQEGLETQTQGHQQKSVSFTQLPAPAPSRSVFEEGKEKSVAINPLKTSRTVLQNIVLLDEESSPSDVDEETYAPIQQAPKPSSAEPGPAHVLAFHRSLQTDYASPVEFIVQNQRLVVQKEKNFEKLKCAVDILGEMIGFERVEEYFERGEALETARSHNPTETRRPPNPLVRREHEEIPRQVGHSQEPKNVWAGSSAAEQQSGLRIAGALQKSSQRHLSHPKQVFVERDGAVHDRLSAFSPETLKAKKNHARMVRRGGASPERRIDPRGSLVVIKPALAVPAAPRKDYECVTLATETQQTLFEKKRVQTDKAYFRVYLSIKSKFKNDSEAFFRIYKLYFNAVPAFSAETSGANDAESLIFNFQQFKIQFSKVILKHKICGADCVHLKRFYRMIGLTSQPLQNSLKVSRFVNDGFA